MWTRQLKGWKASIFMVGVVIALNSAGGAIADNPPTQSDVTGPNVGDYNTPSVFGDIEEPLSNLNGLNTLQAIIGNETDVTAIARDISQALDDAYAQCLNSANAADTPRRFARGAGDPTAICISPACTRLNRLVEETQIFLTNQNQIRDQLRLTSEIRLW